MPQQFNARLRVLTDNKHLKIYNQIEETRKMNLAFADGRLSEGAAIRAVHRLCALTVSQKHYVTGELIAPVHSVRL